MVCILTELPGQHILTFFHINTSETSRWDSVQLKIQLFRVPEFSLDFLAQMLWLRWSNNNVQSLTCNENSNETKPGVFSNSRLVKHRHYTFKQGLYSEWDRRDHHAVYGFAMATDKSFNKSTLHLDDSLWSVPNPSRNLESESWEVLSLKAFHAVLET